MTPQELKNSILQLAIQGKLVEQRPEEGTAEELYKKIQAEKQKLIKAGKIKKEKPLPEITEDEVPFEIPESWKWVRIGKITFNVGQKKPDKQFSYIDVGSIDNNNHTLNKKEVIIEAKDAPSRARKIVNYGDVIFATIRPYLQNICIINRKFKCEAIASTAFAVMSCPEGLCNKFLFFSLLSPFFMSYVNASDKAKGVAYPAIAEKDFFAAIIPLPPLAEQKRIVAKIEELLPLADRYGEAWDRLEELNKRFPDDMRKSVLQLAIQGKLVEQRPEEGTAEELYKKIQAEKQKLIKAGKIKKEKPLPEITEDEVPFEIPKSWKWVRLPCIASTCLGKMLDKQKNKGTKCPYLRNVNVRWGDFDLSDLLEMKFEDVNNERFLIQKNDIVMCEGGEPGRCAIWKDITPIHFQKALHRIRFYGNINPTFYMYFFYFYSSTGNLNYLFTGTTIKHLTGQALDRIVLPLPPLPEQKRIVAKIEELLPLCERLK